MPDAHLAMRTLIPIGYWRSQLEPEWPEPADFVDENWDENERNHVAVFLESGTVPWVQLGVSICRFCGQENGFAECTDGVFLWPEGLAHYVREHAVRLPAPVVDHIEGRGSFDPHQVDSDWWRTVKPDP
jgi:hypothetical protein